MNSLVSRMLPRALVLIYHRVANLESDPQRLSVAPENFDEHMDTLARSFNPISLRTLVDDLGKGYIRDRAVVVTFDDGYEDNYHNARPILEKYGIPATIFVSTNYSRNRREFWWDELERLILRKQGLPTEMAIELNGTVHRWIVSNGEKAREAKVAPKLKQSIAGELELLPHEIYMDLCSRFQGLEAEQINDAIMQLRELTDDSGEARPDYLPMTTEQLRALYGGGLIEIGAHTRSHVNLAAQTAEKQREEIEGSKQDLERILGSSVESFSYPFGTLDHYSSQSIKYVKDAGFSAALANFTGNVTRLSNLYEIPRRMVRNWNKEAYEGALNRYYSGKPIH